VIGEVTYCLVARTITIQLRNILIEHFSPHSFSVMTHGMCETMVHDIQTMLELHPHWVVLYVDVHNAFNSMSRLTNF
jgi:hypothetical protein